ncbi:MAG: J domain-containing protein [Armatimonadetes bacterium]|nr:J domain-containing protein [Armatimonadota bacterium]
MALKKTYYEILGVPRAASQEVIKKRYRQLVRKHHPDVAEDKRAAAGAFLEITEAYQVLTNADRRVIYDAELDRNITEVAPRPARPHASGAKASQSVRTRASGTRPRSGRGADTARVQRLIKQAESSYSRGQLWAALDAAKSAASMDPRNAPAHVIMGDVYRMQGRVDEAVSMYTLALQFDPRNADAMDKLDKAMRRSRKAQSPAASEDRKQVLKTGVGLVVGSLGTLVLFMLYFSPGEPIPWLKDHLPVVGAWTGMLVTALLGMGALIGFTLSMTESLRSLDDELVFQTISAGKRLTYPVGLLLILFSLFNFYAAVVIYVLGGIIQDAMSSSVMKSFVATALVVVVVAVFFPVGARQVLIWGGNLVFPAMLLGWALGDMVKPWG